MPTPRPDTELTWSAVERPIGVDPASVVGDGQGDLVARLTRGKLEQADFTLVRFEAFARAFEPVIDGIADDMGERVADHLDHFAVEFDFAAFEIDHDLLAELVRQVAHEPRQ